MPASSAWLTGARNASLSTTASARPSTLALIAVLVAFTISATIEFCDPVHCGFSIPSSVAASSIPYCVGVKKGLVVTWLTNENFHLGVSGMLPIALELLDLSSLLHALSRAPA